jgi:hypothetical protein
LSDSFLDANISAKIDKEFEEFKESKKPHRNETPSNVFQCPNLSNSAIY